MKAAQTENLLGRREEAFEYQYQFHPHPNGGAGSIPEQTVQSHRPVAGTKGANRSLETTRPARNLVIVEYGAA